MIFFSPKLQFFWKPNSKRYFQLNIRTENPGLFMHEVGVVCFRQITAPGPFVPNAVTVFISDCGASWSTKPRAAALIGSQCNC